jgi:hypothetical protein
MADLNLQSEIGSDFPWCDEYLSGEGIRPYLATPTELFSSGRGAMAALIRQHAETHGSHKLTVHIPNYFCPNVVKSIASQFSVARYDHVPPSASPRWESLRVRPGDIVIAVNFFGVQVGECWSNWARDTPDVTLIEDHTHDPFSAWAVHSTAHYCFASLVKTLPVPDGAVVWSPRQLTIPRPRGPAHDSTYDVILAMLIKRLYMQGGNVSKDLFRSLYSRASARLEALNSAGSPFTSALLERLDIAAMRQRRNRNCTIVIDYFRDRDLSIVSPLFASWPENHAPLNPVLRCATSKIRDALQAHLTMHDVYCPIHWVLPNTTHSEQRDDSKALSATVLTIPTDFRCSEADIDRILSFVSEFVKRHH